MFPESSGAYIAQRDKDLIIVKVKGVYPALQLDDRAADLGTFLSSGKLKEVSKDVLNNIEIMHQKWNFYPLTFINFSVFSKTEFLTNSNDVYLSDEDYYAIRGMYYRLVEQGVSSMKIIRALSYEFKVPSKKAVDLINAFDREARYVD